ncbi:acyl-CoA synthetase/AMP-acid ligase [Hyaloraphidium curvatum]|nr:acyl-CoA synthetase/AMP-acid ligase [Hyaloraphidium curvatum]
MTSAVKFPQIGLHSASLQSPEEFWGEQAKNIDWFVPPKRILTPGNESPDGRWKWFDGGKLNTAWNCVGRHVKAGRGDNVAIIYDSAYTNTRKRLTYAQLEKEVDAVAAMFQEHGVKKGDRVIIYFPMLVEGFLCMLACAKLGAVHSVVFGGFSPAELAKRIDDSKPVLLVHASCGIEPNRVIPYKPLVDEALQASKHKPRKVIVFQRPQVPAPVDPSRGESEWQVEIKKIKAAGKTVPYVPVDAEDPLYILYTSGTTGQPKGVVRSNGGHAVALYFTGRHFLNVGPGDVMFSAADIGWAVGHSIGICAPTLAGATTIVYEGKPITPDPGAFWRIVEEHQVKTMFTAPTALRSLKAADPTDHYVRMHDITSLKALFLAGERCDTDSATHYSRVLGVPVIDNWWQTETGWPISGICTGLSQDGSYRNLPIQVGSAGLPMPGWKVKVIKPKLDEAGEVCEGEFVPAAAVELGSIVIELPLPPGAFRTLWEVFVSAGYYDTTDAGLIDEHNYIHVLGRTDDVINVAGHRLSTGQMEEVVSEHPTVAECAVIGVLNDMKGEVPLAFVVLKSGSDVTPKRIEEELIRTIHNSIGPFACFQKVHVVDKLPKTRSGKVLRRTLRDIVAGRKYTVPGTIEDATILDTLEKSFGPQPTARL